MSTRIVPTGTLSLLIFAVIAAVHFIRFLFKPFSRRFYYKNIILKKIDSPEEVLLASLDTNGYLHIDRKNKNINSLEVME